MESNFTSGRFRAGELAPTKELEKLQGRLTSLRKSYALSKQEFDLTAPLAEKGMVSKVEALRLKREVNDLQSQIDTTVTQIESTEIAILPARAVVGPARATETGQFTKEQVCKAGIATVMGRVPANMNTDRVQNDVIYISYRRANDGSHWVYKCKLEGERIIWGSDNGRWRTHEADSKVIFNVKSDVINVEDRFSDGSSTKKSFIANQIPK